MIEEKGPFSKLVDIFDAIDVSEKGIEIVYDYLLKNKMIEDPKSIYESFGVSLKRIYKIFSVLKDLDLVQVYSRPMKVVLNDPVSSWEKIISDKIKGIRSESDQKISICEHTFQTMLESYSLKPEQPSLPPVEYINILDEFDPLDLIIQEFFTKNVNLFITRGIRVEIQFVNAIFNSLKTQKDNFLQTKQIIQNNLDYLINKISIPTIKILLSQDYLEETMQKLALKDFTAPFLKDWEKTILKFIEIRICPDTIGNFVIKNEEELYQNSVDPNNNLMGLFVSRQKEIIEVFLNKFSELYEKSQDIKSYFLQTKKKAINEGEIFSIIMF